MDNNFGLCFVSGCSATAKMDLFLHGGANIQVCDEHVREVTEIIRKVNDKIKKLARQAFDDVRALHVFRSGK